MVQKDLLQKTTGLKVLLMFAAFGALRPAAAQLYYKSATFNVINATVSVFYPGVQGSPINHNVTFALVMKNCGRLNLDSFWSEGYSDAVSVRYSNGSSYDGKPMKGDTLLVTCTWFEMREQTPIPGGPGITGSPQNPAPMAHKGRLLFRYQLNGKKYYFSIRELKSGVTVYAP